MSGSDDPQKFPNQKKEDLLESKSPQSETAAEEREKEKVQDQTEIPESIKKDDDDETDEATASHREESSEDVDGFKTPTSSDHRLPRITQCPPAPMKLRPPLSKLKRKAASPPRTSPSIQPDEVESIFSPIANDQDDQKTKKARTESSDDQ